MAEEYNKKVTGIVECALIGQTISLATDIGILDALINAEKPLTSVEIADQKQLKERYVREILGCLSGAEIILVSTNENGVNTYSMSEDQKRGREMGFFGFLSGVVGAIGEEYTRVRECAHKSGPYGFNYGSTVMDTLRNNAIRQMPHRLTKPIETVPGLDKKLEEGIDVIEFGTGSGVDIIHLAKMYPKSRFTATDYEESHFLRSKSEWEHLPNLSFRVLDICKMEGQLDPVYDWGFCYDTIHDVPDPGFALKGIRKLLKKPGGVLTFIDFSPTKNGTHQEAVGSLPVASLYAIGTFCCITEGLKYDDTKVLGPCGGQNVLRDLALQAGFDSCTYQALNVCQTIYTCM